jgi:HK97 family phage prohead protease
MPAKQFASMSVKGLQEDGSFEGILASYNTVDLGGDKILPGAFTKTIQERGNEIPMLWQHKSDQPIGSLSLVDSSTGLAVKGQLLMDVPQARVAYSLLKARVIKGLSIGFDTVKDSVENGVRQLKEVRLWEGSVVTFPMNEACMVTNVKANGEIETKWDFNGELSAIQLQDAGYQMRYALFNAIGSITWASLDKDAKVSAVQATIEQFTSAFMSYFPQYLDWLAGEYGDLELMGNLQMEEKDFGALLGRGMKSVAALRKLKSGVISLDQARAELKEGRTISADTMKTLKKAHEHVKSLDDIFGTLIDGEADDDTEVVDSDVDTSKSTAVPEVKTEPVTNHSAAVAIAEQIRALYRSA